MNNPTPEQPQDYQKPVMSVGDEFITWAETYWSLDTLYDNTANNPADKRQEVCSYPIVKRIFIKKINDIIAQRVNGYL